MSNIETDRREIERLLSKCDIKEINNMDYTDDLNEICNLIAMHTPDQTEMDKYIETHKRMALSLLDEPLSDIPMGRVTQLQNVFERELENFKDIYKEYRNNVTTVDALVNQYDKFCAVTEYLCDLLQENSDGDSEYIPGLEESDAFVNNVLVYVGETDISKYCESLEYAFDCFDCLCEYMRGIIGKGDKTLLNALSYNIGLENVYVNCLIDFFRQEKRKRIRYLIPDAFPNL